jgi:hypothetical protein
MQVLTIIRGVGLEGYLTGDTSPPPPTIRVKNPDDKEETDVPNLDMQTWKVTDQQLLGFLLSSMTRDVLS